MATIELHGTLDIDVTGADEIEGKIRSTSIAALQGRIKALAYQILREQAAKDWPAGKASNGYVSTGELVNAIDITGSGLSLTISMDGSRMSMTPPSISSGGGDWGRVGKWGIHMGVQSQPYNTEMPALLEYGGGGLVPHEGSGYFKRTYGMYQEQFIHILAEELRAAGFEVTEG